MSLAGNLKTVSFPDILQLLATGKKSGLLEIRTNSRQKEVAFKDGNIIFASSLNSSEDLLGNMLLQKGKLSKVDLDRAITMHKQTGRQLGTTLIDMNLFDKEEIAECLKLQIEEIVYNLFSWQEGDFIFHQGKAPQNAPFLIQMSTMSVIMEGTRRIDEWIEIQKIIPPDDVLLALARNPKLAGDEVSLSLEEFKILALINGERTVPDLIACSPTGEFVTCRAIYRLAVNNLIETVGKKDTEEVDSVDEEELVMSILFKFYNSCFFRIRRQVEKILGPDNSRFSAFASQYRSGVFTFFPGAEPESELMPSFDRFMAAIRSIPQATRYYYLVSGLETMLGEQLEFVFHLLGKGVYRDAVTSVKKEISDPLARHRDLVKRFNIEENFYKTIKRAERVVRMVRG